MVLGYEQVKRAPPPSRAPSGPAPVALRPARLGEDPGRVVGVGLELRPPPDGRPAAWRRRPRKGAPRVPGQVVGASGPLHQDGVRRRGTAPVHVDDPSHGRGRAARRLVEDAREAIRNVLPRPVAAAVVAPEESAADGAGGGLGDGEHVAVCAGARAGPGEVGDGARGGDLGSFF